MKIKSLIILLLLNMNCSICLENEDDISSQTERIITKCNHFFHKQCLFRYNYEKVIQNCPLCKTPYSEKYTIKNYAYSEIQNIYDEYFHIILQFIKFNKRNVIISGSFAVYLYQLLHNFKPQWKFNDIDIYYKNCDILTKKINIIDDILFVKFKNKNKNDNYIKYSNSNIESVYPVISYDIDDNIENVSEIQKYDLIRIKNEQLYTIVETFDLDCCKIAIQLNKNGITMYIHNSFYVDSYKYNGTKTKNRIIKYRQRGFNVLKI